MRIWIFLLCLIPCFSQAQIINTERLRVGAKEQGWTGTASLSANLVQNVRKSTRLGLLTGVEYLRKPHRMLLLGQYKLNSIDGSVGQNQGYGHLRYNRDIGKRWIVESFGQLQFNAVQLLRLRGLTGAGMRFRLAENDTFSCFVGSLYMFEYEELNDGLGAIHRDHRQSSYFSLGFRLSDQARIDHVSYWQPKWEQVSDFRFSTETRLQVNITKKLALRTVFYLLYDSRPPDGLPLTYYTWSNSLTVSL
ncbi:MAG: DUF481 domain-containing protein [Bacteroidia bacterium]